MPLHSLTEDNLRKYCRAAIDGLEYWLRRLITDELTESFGENFISAKTDDGSSVINAKIRKAISKTYNSNPDRFTRMIDAAQLEDEINIVCNPALYQSHFRTALKEAFPGGVDEARTFLGRLLEPRHCLSHSNPISVRQAEQVICYTQDVIAALKNYYSQNNMEKQYNVPMILRVTDSLGHESYTEVIPRNLNGAVVDFRNDRNSILHPGDSLRVQVLIDPSFGSDTYEIKWASNLIIDGISDIHDSWIVIKLQSNHVSEGLLLYCQVISDKDWHKLGHMDDQVVVKYKVLPPI